MLKILFVAHRYYPFPGGTEYYVRDMAEECQRRGYQVTVLAHEHRGDQNGIKVTNDYQTTLNQKWNLIVVHGGDVISQNIIHQNAQLINQISPVVYMLIKPSESEICLFGLKHHRYIAFSTSMDMQHILKHDVWNKSRRIRHGISPERTIKDKIMNKHKKIYVSAGGFWRHKAMNPLAESFQSSNIQNAELHLYGYYDSEKPKDTDKVKIFLGKERDLVMQAIANADGYILNSYEEGFGLVLLESMMNRTPWFARRIAGAKDLSQYGFTYNTEVELMNHLSTYKRDENLIQKAYDYALNNHSIYATVNDIENILKETL